MSCNNSGCVATLVPGANDNDNDSKGWICLRNGLLLLAVCIGCNCKMQFIVFRTSEANLDVKMEHFLEKTLASVGLNIGAHTNLIDAWL